MCEYLRDNNLALEYGGQALNIVFDTPFQRGRNYYPDLAILTVNNRVAIIEVKPATHMDNFENVYKYRSLADYCEKNGYEYMMVDPSRDFMTYEELRDMKVCPGLLAFFEDWNQKPDTEDRPYKHFDDTDVEEWYVQFGQGYSRDDFRLQVHSLVIRFKWYNKPESSGLFSAYNRPVVINHSGTVVKYI